MNKRLEIPNTLATPDDQAVLFPGNCLKFLTDCPDEFFQLVVTSPPYNLGKSYEKRIHLDDYLAQQEAVISESVRTLAPKGSICWQVGNYVDKGEIIPLDTILYPTRVQIRSATLINGLGGRDAIASEPLNRQVKVAWNELHTSHPSRTIPNLHPQESRS